MMIDLKNYGALQHEGDHFIGFALPTTIGPVDIQIGGVDVSVPDMQNKILAVLNRLSAINTKARAYLQEKARQEVETSGGLVEPSLLFNANDALGNFTLFYSGTIEDDETCYGVEFRNFAPHDLTIGD